MSQVTNLERDWVVGSLGERTTGSNVESLLCRPTQREGGSLYSKGLEGTKEERGNSSV